MLAALAVWGLLALDFEVRPVSAAVLVAVALLTQWFGSRTTGSAFDPRSALISALSLVLLLRTDSLALAAGAALLAVGSKFAIRVGGKHVFNPTNLSLVVLLLASDRVWVSAGQWGSGPIAAAAFVAAAGWVLRSARGDVAVAFVAAWGGLLFGRALWLGDPLAIPLHQLSNGALLLFAGFMISDPRTLPDSRRGRIAFALTVAGLGYVGRFVFYEPNALLFALAASAPLTPFLDRVLPGRRFEWQPESGIRRSVPVQRRLPMRRPNPRLVLPLIAFGLWLPPVAGSGFCGFYVAKADTALFNEASKVAIVRDGERTVLTMANDYRGEPSEFAMVVPVPVVLEEDQIHIASPSLLEHLDAYTAPRLVEYFDDDPCQRARWAEFDGRVPLERSRPSTAPAGAKALGVTIEAEYTVGEYDILILSAEQSDGLATWLRQNDYRIPNGAEPILESYLKQDMHFFVARVNLAEKARTGVANLRPLQMAFETKRFGLPIRLGTVNAAGTQDLFVYALTRTGRVETTNYPTVKLPTGQNIPTFVKDEFGPFYQDLFAQQAREAGGTGVFLEYAWDMAWCDPCAANPLSSAELRELGVFWVGQRGQPKPMPTPRSIAPQAADVFVTRLHIRYDAESFPRRTCASSRPETARNFQGRYVLRHAWEGSSSCKAADEYRASLKSRRETEAATLAELTGRELATIRERMKLTGITPGPRPWWRELWN